MSRIKEEGGKKEGRKGRVTGSTREKKFERTKERQRLRWRERATKQFCKTS
jgi:hypothetical protein